jgi:hypothetical protein
MAVQLGEAPFAPPLRFLSVARPSAAAG